MGSTARSKWDTRPPRRPPLPQTPIQKQTHETEQTAQVMVDLFLGAARLAEEMGSRSGAVVSRHAGKPRLPSSVDRLSGASIHPSRPSTSVCCRHGVSRAVSPPDPGEGNGRNHFNAAAPPSAELSMTVAPCSGDLAGESKGRR